MVRTEENSELSLKHTKNQFEAWVVKFNELLFSKPRYNILLKINQLFKLDQLKTERNKSNYIGL